MLAAAPVVAAGLVAACAAAGENSHSVIPASTQLVLLSMSASPLRRSMRSTRQWRQRLGTPHACSAEHDQLERLVARAGPRAAVRRDHDVVGRGRAAARDA